MAVPYSFENKRAPETIYNIDAVKVNANNESITEGTALEDGSIVDRHLGLSIPNSSVLVDYLSDRGLPSNFVDGFEVVDPPGFLLSGATLNAGIAIVAGYYLVWDTPIVLDAFTPSATNYVYLVVKTGQPREPLDAGYVDVRTSTTTGDRLLLYEVTTDGGGVINVVSHLADLALVFGGSTAKNLVINGGMEVSQRGTTFTNPVHNSFTLDLWRVFRSSDPCVISQSATKDTGSSSMRVDCTPAAAPLYVYQEVENYLDYAGKSVSVTARVLASVGSKVRMSVTDGLTTTYSSYHSGGGGWETLSVTHLLAPIPTNLKVSIGYLTTDDAASFYVDSVMLVEGTTGMTFSSTSPHDELSSCQRYFCKSYDYGVAPGTPSYAGCLKFPSLGGLQADYLPGVRFPVEMAGAPTVVIYGPTTGAAGMVSSSSPAVDVAGTAENVGTGGFPSLSVPGLSATTESFGLYHYTAEVL